MWSTPLSRREAFIRVGPPTSGLEFNTSVVVDAGCMRRAARGVSPCPHQGKLESTWTERSSSESRPCCARRRIATAVNCFSHGSDAERRLRCHRSTVGKALHPKPARVDDVWALCDDDGDADRFARGNPGVSDAVDLIDRRGVGRSCEAQGLRHVSSFGARATRGERGADGERRRRAPAPEETEYPAEALRHIANAKGAIGRRPSYDRLRWTPALR